MKSTVKNIICVLLLVLFAGFILVSCTLSNEHTASEYDADSNDYISTVDSHEDISEIETSDIAEENYALYKKVSFIGTPFEETGIYYYLSSGLLDYIDYGGAKEKYEYDEEHNLIKHYYDNNGKVSRVYEYQYKDGKLIKESFSLDGSVYTVTEYEYDSIGRIMCKSKSDGSKSFYEYKEDGSYNIRLVNQSEESIEKYNTEGLIIETASSQNRSVYTYDENGRLLSNETFGELGDVIRCFKHTYTDSVETVDYSEYGNIVKTVKYYYDPDGNLLKVATISPDGTETINETREYRKIK